MPNYGDMAYWNKRYEKTNGETFDWLEDYESLKDQICSKINFNSRILHLGCGNSQICEFLYDDGYTNIVNIDISEVVIEQMKERNQHRSQMTYLVMDATMLTFDHDNFDMVIDKSTIDAILCGNHSFVNTAKMLHCIQQVLKIGGIYMAISYGEPSSRLLHFQRAFLRFTIQTDTLSRNEENLTHYIYSCTKVASDDQINEQFYETIQQLEEEDSEDQIEEEDDDEDSELFIEKKDTLKQFIDRIKIIPAYQNILKQIGLI